MILPHVGLVLLLIVYLLIGATVFHHMEWENEKKVSSLETETITLFQTKDRELAAIFDIQDQFVDRVWNMTHDDTIVFSRQEYDTIAQVSARAVDVTHLISGIFRSSHRCHLPRVSKSVYQRKASTESIE
jgi:hypothetical protein